MNITDWHSPIDIMNSSASARSFAFVVSHFKFQWSLSLSCDF